MLTPIYQNNAEKIEINLWRPLPLPTHRIWQQGPWQWLRERAHFFFLALAKAVVVSSNTGSHRPDMLSRMASNTRSTLVLSDQLKDCTVTSHLVSNILRRMLYSFVRSWLIRSSVAHWSSERGWATNDGPIYPGGPLDNAFLVCARRNKNNI